MEIDEVTFRRIARLARIHVTNDDVADLKGELSGILGWVEQLSEVDTTHIATTNVTDMTLDGPAAAPLREDIVTDGEKADDVVANAPVTHDNFFCVPKVIE